MNVKIEVEVDERLIEVCNADGVKAEFVLKMFAADLIATGPEGVTSGSDERLYAKLYYDRCGYSMHTKISERLEDVAQGMAEHAGIKRSSTRK